MRASTVGNEMRSIWLIVAIGAVIATSCGSAVGSIAPGPNDPDSPAEPNGPADFESQEPIAIYVENPDGDGALTPAGTFIFHRPGDDVEQLIDEIAGDDVDRPDLRAQLEAVDLESQFVIVVARSACAPSHFELTATDVGFTHTMWRMPVLCVWAPVHAAVYVVPRVTADGVEFNEDNAPEIAYETIEES